jgi:hypothetical protein
MNTDFELFSGTTFSDLMKDIYHNSKRRTGKLISLLRSCNRLLRILVMLPS